MPPDGLSCRTPTADVHIDWIGFVSIRETGSFLFFELDSGNYIVVFKGSLSGEKIREVREIVNSCPVPLKRLRV
jgi:predicted RNA binding protein YcfA (HicA-like mRNA interferase family)